MQSEDEPSFLLPQYLQRGRHWNKPGRGARTATRQRGTTSRRSSTPSVRHLAPKWLPGTRCILNIRTDFPPPSTSQDASSSKNWTEATFHQDRDSWDLFWGFSSFPLRSTAVCRARGDSQPTSERYAKEKAFFLGNMGRIPNTRRRQHRNGVKSGVFPPSSVARSGERAVEDDAVQSRVREGAVGSRPCPGWEPDFDGKLFNLVFLLDS